MSTFFAPDRFDSPEFTLRSYLPGDGEKLSDAVNSSYEHLTTFMAWAKPYQSVEESEALVRRFRAGYLTNADFVIGIFSPDGTMLLGGCGFHLREGALDTGNAEIGMWIRASHAGKGLGTAALKGMIRWGFSEWPWTRLSWQNDTLNTGSRRAAEKAGMTHEGTLRKHLPDHHGGGKRDAMIFSILKEEWQDEKA